MSQKSIHNNQSGFTLIELLLAMAFFGFILIFFTVGFVQVSRTFQRSTTIKQVTETGRAAIVDMANNIRLSGGAELYPQPGTDVNRLCLNNGTQYAWSIAGSTPEPFEGEPSSAISLVRIDRSRSLCDAEIPPTSPGAAIVGENDSEQIVYGSTSLLQSNINVQNFTVTQVGSNALRLDLLLSAGPEDLISDAGTEDAECDGFAEVGSQFCDTIRFVTTVGFRL